MSDVRSLTEARVTRKDSIVCFDANMTVPLEILFCSVRFTRSKTSVIICKK